MAYILIYVDDIILISSSYDICKSIMTLLASELAMKEMGPLSYFLGIVVTKHANGLFLSRSTYINDIIAQVDMASCKPSATPIDTKQKLNTSTIHDDPTLYRSIIGALQYLTFIRPNISYGVQQVCLHIHAPCTEHMLALKRIMRYVQGTLWFVGWDIDVLTPVDLLMVIVFFLVDNLILWPSKRQLMISCSNAEAEYRDIANVILESSRFHNLLLELIFPFVRLFGVV